jgi:tetratricopeptide (TPR) repeat protein
MLLALIAIELAVGAMLAYRQRGRPTPPIPDLAGADPAFAAHIRERAASCRTPDDWAALGLDYLAFGYFPEGEACYRRAAELEPERTERQFEWAFALERIGRLSEANSAYEGAAVLGHAVPNDCRYFIGRNHLRLEDVPAARAAFEKAGNHPSARYELARLLVRDGKLGEGIPILDQLAAEHRDAVQPPLLRHRIEVEVLAGGGPNLVADRAQRATGRLPTPFDREFHRLEAARDRIGRDRELKDLRKLLEGGNTASAEPRLRQIAAADWGPDVADLLAEVEFMRGRPAEAARILQETIDRAGPAGPLLERLGDAHAEAGRGAEAAAAWERATRLATAAEMRNAWFKLATHHDAAGKKDEARRCFARAYLGAAHEALAAGKLDDVRVTLEKAVENDANLAMAWYYLGELHRRTGEAARARAAYEKCLAIDGHYGRARAALDWLPK